MEVQVTLTTFLRPIGTVVNGLFPREESFFPFIVGIFAVVGVLLLTL